jgi:hypothetical protein
MTLIKLLGGEDYIKLISGGEYHINSEMSVRLALGKHEFVLEGSSSSQSVLIYYKLFGIEGESLIVCPLNSREISNKIKCCTGEDLYIF